MKRKWWHLDRKPVLLTLQPLWFCCWRHSLCHSDCLSPAVCTRHMCVHDASNMLFLHPPAQERPRAKFRSKGRGWFLAVLAVSTSAWHSHRAQVWEWAVTRDDKRPAGCCKKETQETTGTIVMTPWKMIHKHPLAYLLPLASLSDGLHLYFVPGDSLWAHPVGLPAVCLSPETPVKKWHKNKVQVLSSILSDQFILL